MQHTQMKESTHSWQQTQYHNELIISTTVRLYIYFTPEEKKKSTCEEETETLLCFPSFSFFKTVIEPKESGVAEMINAEIEQDKA